MDDKKRCQSCGMPLGDGAYGSERDGSPAESWCRLCYQEGRLTEPALTLAEMVERSISYMTSHLNFSREQATELSQSVIPHLDRWREKP